jgi:hypothetical protein
VTTFNRDNVSFNDGSMTLSYNSNGDILLDSQATGANSITGTVVANRLDISASGDIDLDTEIVELKVANNGSSINVDVSAKKDLVVEQVDAGAAGDIVLTSKDPSGSGVLTFKTFNETHLIANNVILGTISERFNIVGEVDNQLRADVFTSLNISAKSYFTPDFINQQPIFTATGDKSKSFTGAETSQGLKSLKGTVEEVTQVDQAIFNEVSSYSIGADAPYNPEMRLIDGVFLPIDATAADDEYDDYSHLQNLPLKPASEEQTDMEQL